MAESIIRGKKQGFTVLYNSVLMDNRLDLKTKGLFAIVQSFPEDWEYSVSGLAARVGIGRDGIRGCLRQLEEAGYLLREQPHGEHGHFSRTTFVFQDQAPVQKSPSTEKPSPVKPSTVEPSPVNPTQVKKQVSKETSNKPPIVPQGVDEQAQLFDRFWKAYPRHEGKEPARRAWRRLKANIQLCRIMSAALARQKTSESWQRDGGRYIPMPATWLNQHRWEDEPTSPAQSEPSRPDDGRRGRFL
jgi:hypothetical protein